MKLQFTDNKGKSIHLDDGLTIKELVRLGLKHIKITPPDAPLPDGWFQHTPKLRNNK